MGQNECKGCSGADPTTDTVKINAEQNATLLAETDIGKDPGQALLVLEAGTHQRQENERARLEQERELERRRAEEAELKRKAEEERRKTEEKCRLQEQTESERKALPEAESAREALRMALEAEAAERKAKEEAEKEVLKQAQLEADEFLRSRGFKGVAVPRKKMFKTCYALHVAVEENCLVALQALLKCGADKAAKNSAGKTALEVACKIKKGNSHDAAIAALS